MLKFGGVADIPVMSANTKIKAVLPVVLVQLTKGQTTLRAASEKTGYSIRWLSSLKTKYRLQGEACLTHGNKNKIPHNKTPESIKRRVVNIYITKYKDVNFKYFAKCLKLYEGVELSYWTVKQILNEFGINSPEAHKVKKVKKINHRPRPRREHEGELMQIDGTPYPIFKQFGDLKNYDIHGGIDDATGKLTGLYICENECLYGYMELLRITAERCGGLPESIYSDRAAIFCVTPREKKNLTVWEQLAGVHDKRTQWQRILTELNIKQILAWSPEAKGRIERAWKTIQGRLPQFLYLHGADTVAKANAVLNKFVDEFNEEFAVTPARPHIFYIQAPDNLGDVLQCQIERQTNHAGQFSFYAYKWLIKESRENVANKKITICISERGIYARLPSGNYYPVELQDDYIYKGDIPQVLEDIIYRYMYAYAKELSA